ncbi:hypothetical protein E6W36_03995 [Hankyongella ginsenosidimutans]|uniref:Uncharacterized protein n=1 Tax=Hankyongella ginsenosidimutans TaxID=1763828 RepID=A0A4D7C019_9SPHN|nr:hypothetical protein [Hankyongella ginsenosidimutans]QCI79044.1 hypothetical protein E6W36_03995 [Hankyongella ginsenosidimutans]
MRLRRWIGFARDAAATPAGKHIAALARLGVVALVIAFLVLRLNAVGWRETLNALPESPWFYILFLGFYFSLPLFETAIYRRLWGCHGARCRCSYASACSTRRSSNIPATPICSAGRATGSAARIPRSCTR